jgi:hypothetical protein
VNQITEQIWIGSSQDAKDLGAIRAAGIDSILNVAEDLQPALGWKDGITHFHVGLRDNSNAPSLYKAACYVLDALVDSGKKVLVHCHEGRSRSPYIVALYMTNKKPDAFNHSIPATITFLKSIRPQIEVHPGHFQFAV